MTLTPRQREFLRAAIAWKNGDSIVLWLPCEESGRWSAPFCSGLSFEEGKDLISNGMIKSRMGGRCYSLPTKGGTKDCGTIWFHVTAAGRAAVEK